MEEIWKDIEGYEGHYQVSIHGRVKSLERLVKSRTSNCGFSRMKERILKPGMAGNGYYMVALYMDRVQTCRTLHSIIASAFIPNPENKPTVNHINGIRTDNRIENLEWNTYSENNYHAVRELNRVATWKGKFGKDNPHSKPVLQLDKSGHIIAEYVSVRDAARLTEGSPTGISTCCRGQLRHHRGYIWRYK